MANGNRSRKPADERITVLDQRIKFHQEKIQLLESRRKEILNPPKKRKTKADALNEIYKAAKAGGKTLEDVLKMLRPEP
jgi:hypothetical protein